MHEDSFVKNQQYGNGQIIRINEKNKSAVVLFSDNLPRILPLNELVEIPDVSVSLKKSINSNITHINKILAKVQGMLIKHVNDRWGVFSRSAIDLLPHQLWVCNQVVKKWPVRYLVADDVGLGKTIEAGLIIWALKEARDIKRILILAPASLTEQWQERLSNLFDLNFNIYRSSNDRDVINFWDTNKMIIVSATTIQMRNNQKQIDRQHKLFEADPWDLVIVDEAHHMNAAERLGETLEYQLFEQLQDANKIKSKVLFTGTPHRGFDYNFWKLMHLVAPEEFDPTFDSDEMYSKLGNYFIRNNKANTVTMDNKPLFKPIKQHPFTFDYTDEETEFYNRMTDFIKSGKAYAQTLDAQEITRVQLVLIQLQKLASSSIAAVKHALITRRTNLTNAAQKLNNDYKADWLSESDIEDSPDLKNAIQDYRFKLMEDEVKNLDELITLGNAVDKESRIEKIIEIVDTYFPDRNVLFFTEYIHTQSLLMSALMKKWGTDCVTFINGNGRVDDVLMPDGSFKRFDMNRYDAANEFNDGNKRFLISTEAAGEGIDLQKNCYTLIHVDLPWNPMRLHQRVGRINRYGQEHSVDVITLRNPQTVEALVWSKLENKLDSIQQTFSAGMGDPEDMMELVLGMHGHNFSDVFKDSFNQSPETFSDWFDARTQTFGNEDTLKTVRNLVGHANKFHSDGFKDIPKLDIPDLIPYFKRVIKLNGRVLNYNEIDDTYTLKNTPEEWQEEYGIEPLYKGLIFRRHLNKGEKLRKICGVGHKLFDKGLEYSNNIADYTCYISGPVSYFIYKLYDMRTDENNFDNIHLIVISYNSITQELKKLKLDEALKTINTIKASTLEEKEHLKSIPKVVDELAENELKSFDFSLPDYSIQAILSGEID